jgi:prefoldin alpha subunit
VLALKSNLATLQQQIEKKQDNFTACGEMMRVKMAQQQQAQAAGDGPKDE